MGGSPRHAGQGLGAQRPLLLVIQLDLELLKLAARDDVAEGGEHQQPPVRAGAGLEAALHEGLALIGGEKLQLQDHRAVGAEGVPQGIERHVELLGREQPGLSEVEAGQLRGAAGEDLLGARVEGEDGELLVEDQDAVRAVGEQRHVAQAAALLGEQAAAQAP